MLGCRSLAMMGPSRSRSTRTSGLSPSGTLSLRFIMADPKRCSPLRQCHLAAVVRGLLDSIDKAVQLDCGRKGRMLTVAVVNCTSKHCVHLPHIDGLAWRRTGCGQFQ